MTYNANHDRRRIDRTRDRTYWRSESDRRLIEAARDSGHELAIALGERLDTLQGIEERLKDAETEAKELDARADSWKAEALALQELLDAMAAKA